MDAKMCEKQKGDFIKYGFLLDRDVSKAASFFPKKRTKTIADIDLSDNAPDLKIIREAWERKLTIVTGNGEDFVKEIHKFLGQTKRAECHEMYGLIILPNGYERQKQVLPGIEDRLRLGRKKITWMDVAYRNCYVRVKGSGSRSEKVPAMPVLSKKRTKIESRN